ncbi:MAG: hypothetical protein RIE59_27660, partial [Imperialibacter sp.]
YFHSLQHLTHFIFYEKKVDALWLMNLLGRESHRSSFVGDISTIDLKHQPKGIYLLLIENEMGEVLKRVKVSKE